MTDHTHPRPAAGSPVDCDVGRLEPQRAEVGSVVECDVRRPGPQTLRYTLQTPASVEHANKLLANKHSGWRLARGCHECAWGKVAGCWRCGSRG